MNRETILNAFQFRHACKEFDPERKIADCDFDLILEAARLSPSSLGLEPWRFLVVQDPKIREAALPFFKGGRKQLPTASHLIFTLVRRGAQMRYDSAYVQHIMQDIQHLPPEVIAMLKDFSKNFQEHDFDLLQSERTLTDWSTHQCYIPLANMMTVAALLGIDSCPMEGFDKRAMDALLSERLKVDTERFTMVYAVAFGYRKNAPRPKTRQSRPEIVTWIRGDETSIDLQ